MIALRNRRKGMNTMTTCTEKHHPNHTHEHGPNCGHTAVRHAGHVDYLHDGHLHHMHGDHVDEHVIAVSSTNPVQCTPQTRCWHKHGAGCGHETVPHADHVDYLVNGFQLPTIFTPTMAPNSISVRRDSPRHMTVFPGGGSLARAR